jgi:ABC-type bacteriocin/lantibiotic exporter with double-glycine peptidase domain
LSIHGQEHELEEVASRVKLGPEGASLGDMQRAATDMGVASSAVRLSNLQLSEIALPAIAHLDVRGGHYLLLLEVGPDTVTTVDMSSAEIKEMPRDVFLETWSGYVLIRGTVLNWGTVLWRGLALCFICSGVAGLLHVLRHNHNQK